MNERRCNHCTVQGPSVYMVGCVNLYKGPPVWGNSLHRCRRLATASNVPFSNQMWVLVFLRVEGVFVAICALTLVFGFCIFTWDELRNV